MTDEQLDTVIGMAMEGRGVSTWVPEDFDMDDALEMDRLDVMDMEIGALQGDRDQDEKDIIELQRVVRALIRQCQHHGIDMEGISLEVDYAD